MEAIECARCGRRLKSSESRAVGYGPFCYKKIVAEWAAMGRDQSDIEIRTTVRDGYAGARDQNGNVKVVTIRGGQQYLLPHLAHHSPDGFNWGYSGSGPADLARSIIADALGVSDPDPAVYQEFKRSFVAGWGDRWEISLDDIRKWAEEKGLLEQAAK